MFWLRSPAPDTPVARFALPIPDGRMLTLSRRAVTVSPDGSQIAYAADGRIYLRLVAEAEARLPGWRRSGDPPDVLSGGAIARVLGGRRAQTDLDRRRCAGDDLSVTPAPFDIDWDDSGILFAQFGTGLSVTRRRRASSNRATDRQGRCAPERASAAGRRHCPVQPRAF